MFMRKLLLLLGIIFVVLISIAVIFILNSPARELTQQEKEKALTQIVGRKLNLTGKDLPQGDVAHKGKYSLFMYPQAAKIYHQMVNGKEVSDQGALEYFAFDLEDPKIYVVTEVIPASSSIINLSDYPAVRLRQTDSQYTQNLLKTSVGTQGLGFDKIEDNSFEKTAFFLVNNRIYSFSVISVDKKAGIQIFDKIISTLKIY
jgi:hypothetical protein